MAAVFKESLYYYGSAGIFIMLRKWLSIHYMNMSRMLMHQIHGNGREEIDSVCRNYQLQLPLRNDCILRLCPYRHPLLRLANLPPPYLYIRNLPLPSTVYSKLRVSSLQVHPHQRTWPAGSQFFFKCVCCFFIPRLLS